jgi:class 3 adenylate cyclase
MEPYLDTPDLFRHLGKVMMGECLLLSEQHETTPYLLTVLAPQQIRRSGGTKDLVELWPFKENHINIDPTQFLGKIHKNTIKQNIPEVHAAKNPDFKRKITNVLFADIVGFSSLMAENTPKVFLDLLKETKKILTPYREEIEIINTWGDGIIICHPDVVSLTSIAFAITNVFNKEMAQKLNWSKDLSVRIALHNGPAFFASDPITENPNVYGTTIIRTARMEPVTLPGAIYASDQFAATLKLSIPFTYSFKHVGIINLPKGYGRQEVYQIIRQG